jgi:hypothetical protein
MDLDFVDSDLAAALEASAKEYAASQNDLILPATNHNSGVPMDRKTNMQLPTKHHFSNPPAPGYFMTKGVINQFHNAWKPLITKYQTPAAICGYHTVANLKIMSRISLPTRENNLLTLEDVEMLISATKDVEIVKAEVELAMSTIANMRSTYINNNADKFNKATEKQYMRAWVANYEISQLLRDLPNNTGNNIHFLRHNQYPELRTATFEEKEILEEEKRFGGSSNQTGSISFKEGDSMFCVERFHPVRKLQTPNEWLEEEMERESLAFSSTTVADETTVEGEEKVDPITKNLTTLPYKLFALDLNGHFTACIACKTVELGNTLILLNTTGTNYATKISFSWLYDLNFQHNEAIGGK